MRLAWKDVIGAMRDVDFEERAVARDGAVVVVKFLRGHLCGRLLLGRIQGTVIIPAEPTMKPVPLSEDDPRVRVLGAVSVNGKS